MRPLSELLKTSKPSRPCSSLKATRVAPTVKGTSVSRPQLRTSFHVSHVLREAEIIFYIDPRWASWNLGVFVCIRYDTIWEIREDAEVLMYLKMLWHTSRNGHAYQSGEVGGPGCLDGRAATERSTLG